MLNCKKASQLISQSLNKSLSWNERLSLKLHLLICKNCDQIRQQFQTLHVAIKRIGKNIEDDETIILPAESRKRIEQSIDSID